METVQIQIAKIADSADDQARATQRVSDAVRPISDGSSSLASLSKQMANGCVKLDDLSNDLAVAVEKFRFERDPALSNRGQDTNPDLSMSV
ncbi:MAG: methyl-accepting chemotaxis protein [Planctomycetales bacterium]|nr:methyl-accepting chemotaxis protein [Planctomycetales bacterium]